MQKVAIKWEINASSIGVIAKDKRGVENAKSQGLSTLIQVMKQHYKRG